MNNSNDHNRLDRIEEIIAENAKAIGIISQGLQVSSQTENTNLSTQSHTKKLKSLVSVIIASTVGTNIVTAVTVAAIIRNGNIQLEQNLYEKDQRTVELNLYLADFWENNFDKETRNLLAKIPSNDIKKRDEIIAFLASLNNKSEFNKNQIKKHIMDFLKLNSKAENFDIIAEATPYRIALTRTFNTLETVATVRRLVKTDEAKCLIDQGYKSTIQESYNQLKQFMYSTRQTQPTGKKDAWKPLEEILTNEWSTTSTSSQSSTNKAQNTPFCSK